METTSQGKILILSQEIYPQVCVGGLGKFVAGISQGLKKSGWQVTVFGPQKRKQIYLPYWSLGCQQRACQIARRSADWCLKNSWLPSWIWVQDWEGVYQAEIWKKLSVKWFPKPRILWTIHSPVSLNGAPNYGYSDREGKDDTINWGNDFFDFSALVKKGVDNADLITTVSDSYANELNRLEFFEKKNIQGFGNGIDFIEWNPSQDHLVGFRLKDNWQEFKKVNKIILQKYFGIPQKEVPVFTFVSRLVPQKGIDLMIKTFPHFLSQNDIQLIVVGQGLAKYHRFFSELKKQFSAQVGLCLQSNFSLPHQVFAGSDFLLLPSLSEPFGIVVAEGRSYGVVPIVHGVGGLKDQVKDEANGLSFEKNYPQSFLKKLYSAVKLKKTDQWWDFSQKGRYLVKDWPTVAKEYEQYLLEADQSRYSSVRWPEKEMLFN